jgi:peptidylprolyl isomerase
MTLGQTVPVPSLLRRDPFRALAGVTCALALVAGACGDDEATDDSTTTTARSEEAGSGSTDVSVPPECNEPSSPEESAVIERGEPDMPEDVPAPGETVDTETGTGTAAAAGDQVTMHYVVFDAADGSTLESTWSSGSPRDIALAQAPPPIADGLVGMQPGGRRVYTVAAADLEQYGLPEGIESGDTIVFVVDLVSASAGDASGGVPDEAAVAEAQQRGKPEAAIPDDLPTELVITDDVVGTGATVCPGDTVTAFYVGRGAETGEVFDQSSWDGDTPTTFPLDGVIQGWTQGLVGMKVGGRRTLVIPGDLAYGEDPREGSGIEPNETLVFTIDLVGVS